MNRPSSNTRPDPVVTQITTLCGRVVFGAFAFFFTIDIISVLLWFFRHFAAWLSAH